MRLEGLRMVAHVRDTGLEAGVAQVGDLRLASLQRHLHVHGRLTVDTGHRPGAQPLLARSPWAPAHPRSSFWSFLPIRTFSGIITSPTERTRRRAHGTPTRGVTCVARRQSPAHHPETARAAAAP